MSEDGSGMAGPGSDIMHERSVALLPAALAPPATPQPRCSAVERLPVFSPPWFIDHGASVSTGFPSADFGRDPVAPARCRFR